MKSIKLSSIAASLLVCVAITNCNSQTTSSGNKSGITVFIATTPCDDVSKKLLNIPLDKKAAMMKWRLELNENPATYVLHVTYGMDKQASRDFSPGAQVIELKGKWTINKNFPGNNSTAVYTLRDDISPIALSFLKADDNVLHLLDADHKLVVGNGAWSYTLNRIDPVAAPSSKLSMQKTSLLLQGDSTIFEVFDGRTPCNTDLLALNGISASGCQIIKCRLILNQDVATHSPTTFQLFNIYVGKGDNRYSITGKWSMSKGTATDPEAIVYQLEPDTGKRQSILFTKADDNILFMLDSNRNLLVGNEYTSFTLNRVKK